MNHSLYPFVFDPIFKDRIWGGQKLKTVFHKNIPNDLTGESWELSAVPGDISIVSNGEMSGVSLQELIEQQPENLLGNKVHQKFGFQFPLLFKLIDAREDLSIQVHPNDELAQKHHQSFGKTEMWYVMQADQGSRLIVGFKNPSSSQEYKDHLAQKTLLSILDEKPVTEGDVFFLDTGTIHAIGAGIMIAEIQQTSDITYRIYDWDRVDAQGISRELHIDLALEAMNYEVVDAKRPYSKTKDTANEVAHCPYFATNYLSLSEGCTRTHDGQSFRVYMGVEGTFSIRYEDQEFAFAAGQTILVPACIMEFELKGTGAVLEVFVP